MSDDLLLFRLTARPCGHSHHSLRALFACVLQNGVPGFDVVADPLLSTAGDLR